MQATQYVTDSVVMGSKGGPAPCVNIHSAGNGKMRNDYANSYGSSDGWKKDTPCGN